jgi:putative ATP-binding cassette transporter
MHNLTRLLALLVKLASSLRRPRLQVAAVLATSVVAGAASTALLALINGEIHRPGSLSVAQAWAFAGLCVALPVSGYLAQVLLGGMTQAIARDLRLALARRILAAPLRDLEQLGPSRLLATLTDDVTTLINSFAALPRVCLNLTVIASGLAYLGYLAWQLLLLVLLFTFLAMITYRVPLRRSVRHYQQARAARDDVFEQLRSLIAGTKELKMHRPRRDAFLAEKLRPSAEALRVHQVSASAAGAVAVSWGQVLSFLVIAVLLFVVPRFHAVDGRALGGFTLIIVYLLTPLSVIFSMLPEMGRTLVAAERIESLGLSLAARTREAQREAGALPAVWQRLTLQGVEHTYYHEEQDDSFTLGPIDLEIRAGDLVFLVGGNGSGKTTLAKLLIGLYPPQAGKLCLDGRPIDDRNRDAFRQLFSVVFADFFLFDALLGIGPQRLDDRVRGYLERFHLARKVRVEHGALSTLDLSQGQRKRLALLTAYLEDRPTYLFDEWAADQDPQFKQIFYRQLLPELHAAGKTVLVISHDEPYYRAAARILKLDGGRIVFDGPPDDYLAFVAANAAPAAEMEAGARAGLELRRGA